MILNLLTSCGNEPKSTNVDTNSEPATTTTTPPADTTKKSIPRELETTVGNATFKIKYHSPGVRERVIWGGLVPYDDVWVTGGHKATSLEVSSDFQVNNTKIPAGKYALFTIPGKEEWTVILNKNWDQHLTDEYNAADDILRFQVKPVANPHTERLTYRIDKIADKQADITMAWEKLKITFPIESDK
jgi:hypothetical protein